jgi:predicted dehydrogenase
MTNEYVGIGMIGTGSWANAGHLNFYSKNPKARLVAVCDIIAERATAAAKQFGAEFASTSYEEVIARDDVEAIDIATPNVLHAPIALAALKAGKHVICEKPMAMNYREAVAMTQAAQQVGVKTAINFVYRCHPAAQFARHLVQEGNIGRIFQVNAYYLQGWLVDSEVPLVWRLQKEMTGTGVLGDLASHIIDLVEWMSGERIQTVMADMQTFITERRLPGGSGSGRVDVDDAANFLVRFGNGALGTFTNSRYAAGLRNHQGVEIYGEKGALIYAVDDADHIQAALGPAFIKEQIMVRIPVPRRFKPADESNFFSRQNRAGHIYNWIEAILEDKEMFPNFQDGLRNQEVLEAIEISARERRWVDLPLA